MPEAVWVSLHNVNVTFRRKNSWLCAYYKVNSSQDHSHLLHIQHTPKPNLLRQFKWVIYSASGSVIHHVMKTPLELTYGSENMDKLQLERAAGSHVAIEPNAASMMPGSNVSIIAASKCNRMQTSNAADQSEPIKRKQVPGVFQKYNASRQLSPKLKNWFCAQLLGNEPFTRDVIFLVHSCNHRHSWI